MHRRAERYVPARQIWPGRCRDAALVYVPTMNVQIIYRADRYHRSGDHQSFFDRGYPAIRFTEPTEDYATANTSDVRMVDGVQHGDVPEAVDFVYVGDVTRVKMWRP